MTHAANITRRPVFRTTLAVCLVPLALLVFTCSPSSAQSEEAVDLHPLKTSDTSSPRATLKSFIDGFDDMYGRFYGEGRRHGSDTERRTLATRVLRCLDLSEVPESVRDNVGRERAVLLKETLDRIELPPEDTWPGDDSESDEQIQRWTVPNTEITITRIAEGPRQGEYLFSPQTVDRAVEFYEIVRRLPYKERESVTPGIYRYFRYEPGWMISRTWIRALPTWAQARWLDQTVWQWVLLIATLVAALSLMAAIYLLGRWRAKKLRSNVMRYLITLAFPVTAMLVPLASLHFITEQIRVTGGVLLVASFSLRMVFLLALMVVLLGAGSRIAALVNATPWIQRRGLDAQLVRLFCRVVSIVAAIVVFLEGGRQLGIPLTTLVASAGVGGLALALAAQDTLKNVFGSIMITLDKPFQIGELIKAKGYLGFVEEIGLRSTKLRMLNGHQASIPNEAMARSDIENIGRRPFVRHSAVIDLPSTTPVSKIKRALEIVRNEVENHRGREDDRPPRIFLKDLKESALGLYYSFWYHPPDYWESMAEAERISIRIFERLEAEDIRVLTPALTIHVADEGGNDSQGSP